jgi:hypothetical protein
MFLGFPILGVVLIVALLPAESSGVVTAAAFVAGIAAAGVDYLRRRELSAIAVGVVAGVLSVVLAYTFLIGAIVVVCGTGHCSIE